VSAPASCASPPHQSDVEASALASLGLVFKHEVRLLDRPADVFSVAASDSILNDLLRDGLKVRGVVMGVSRVHKCIACVVEGGALAPDVVSEVVDLEEDIALTRHPTGRDAVGRMLFLAPDADKALQLVRRHRFPAKGGAGFTFTLAETAPPDGSSAMRIVLPDGTDAASRDRVLGAVVENLASKGFAVEGRRDA